MIARVCQVIWTVGDSHEPLSWASLPPHHLSLFSALLGPCSGGRWFCVSSFHTLYLCLSECLQLLRRPGIASPFPFGDIFSHVSLSFWEWSHQEVSFLCYGTVADMAKIYKPNAHISDYQSKLYIWAYCRPFEKLRDVEHPSTPKKLPIVYIIRRHYSTCIPILTYI